MEQTRSSSRQSARRALCRLGSGGTHRQVLDVLRKPGAVLLVELLQTQLQPGVFRLHLLQLAPGGEQHLGTASVHTAALSLQPNEGH